ncbi:MAG: hypothetical protein V1701_02875 [Planctomycetota bacterium]
MKIIQKKCLKCNNDFSSSGKANRLCPKCSKENDRIGNTLYFNPSPKKRIPKQKNVGISAEFGNWCPEYKRFIDDELVNKIKPDCIARNNGCGNCPKITYRQFINGQAVTSTGPTIKKLFEALK